MVSKIIEVMLDEVTAKVESEVVEAVTLEYVKNVAEAFDGDVEKAMELLIIPREERDRYRELLS